MKLKINVLFFGALFVLLVSAIGAAAQEKPARDEKIIFKTLTLKKTGTLRGRDFTISRSRRQRDRI